MKRRCEEFEIERAMWELGLEKAPGPDGYIIAFSYTY